MARDKQPETTDSEAHVLSGQWVSLSLGFVQRYIALTVASRAARYLSQLEKSRNRGSPRRRKD